MRFPLPILYLYQKSSLILYSFHNTKIPLLPHKFNCSFFAQLLSSEILNHNNLVSPYFFIIYNLYHASFLVYLQFIVTYHVFTNLSLCYAFSIPRYLHGMWKKLCGT